METEIVRSILVSLLCVVAIAGLVEILNWLWLRPKKLERWLRKQGIPGTSYRLLSGDFKDLASQRAQAMAKPMSSFSHDYVARLDPFCHQLGTKFGEVFFMWTGPQPTIVISKPELIREALTKTQEVRKPKTNPIVDELFVGLVNYQGEKWVQHRRMLNPAFHTEKLKLMLPAFYASCEKMINKWEELVTEAGQSEVDVWPHLNMLSADVISRATFGSSYEEGNKMFPLFKEQLLSALGMLQSVYIPGLRYIPTAGTRTFREVNDQIDTILKGIIDKRKKAMEVGKASKDDLLGILLDSNMKEIQQAAASGSKKPQHGISLQEVIEECRIFYLAGQETTSILLVWTLILLSKHQDWQERARAEILQTFGNNAPDFESLNHLKTVTMILNEVLRMYPPTPKVPRTVYKDTKLGELSIPAGSLLNIQFIYAQRDKESWGDDAEEFRPERFSEGISKALKGNCAFFPFGWGPRICIGEKFAMMEAKIAVAMILQRFSLELSPSYVHSPMNVFTLWPQHGAQIILHRLRQ